MLPNGLVVGKPLHLHELVRDGRRVQVVREANGLHAAVRLNREHSPLRRRDLLAVRCVDVALDAILEPTSVAAAILSLRRPSVGFRLGSRLFALQFPNEAVVTVQLVAFVLAQLHEPLSEGFVGLAGQFRIALGHEVRESS